MDKFNRTNIITIAILLVILLATFIAMYFLIFNSNKVSEDAPLNKALSTEKGTERFTDLDGNQVLLDDDFGKYIVVFTWASWCPECASDLPVLDAFAAEYATQNIKVIAVNRAENKFTAIRYLDSLGTLSSLEVLLDADDTFFAALDGYAMPEAVLYGTDGEVLLHQRGKLNIEEIKEVLAAEE